ncbi:hypothetical protein JTB14_000667 [Gonioctena quinquepunctata]|nr:hypothetical protein JTB14_000667 [Gonioctena quinquepunctata]
MSKSNKDIYRLLEELTTQNSELKNQNTAIKEDVQKINSNILGIKGEIDRLTIEKSQLVQTTTQERNIEKEKYYTPTSELHEEKNILAYIKIHILFINGESFTIEDLENEVSQSSLAEKKKEIFQQKEEEPIQPPGQKTGTKQKIQKNTIRTRFITPK